MLHRDLIIWWLWLVIWWKTSLSDDEYIERIYENIKNVIEEQDSCRMLNGDWNKDIGEGMDGKVVEKYGICVRNKGDRLAEFFWRSFSIANKWFENHNQSDSWRYKKMQEGRGNIAKNKKAMKKITEK